MSSAPSIDMTDAEYQAGGNDQPTEVLAGATAGISYTVR